MDYLSAVEISASGMLVEKLRLEAVARNIANANTPASNATQVYKPVNVVSAPILNSDFGSVLRSEKESFPVNGVKITELREDVAAAKSVYEPRHPYANENGMVLYPDVDPLSEMVKMMNATRSYEANVKVMNATKAMLQNALEIGRGR